MAPAHAASVGCTVTASTSSSIAARDGYASAGVSAPLPAPLALTLSSLDSYLDGHRDSLQWLPCKLPFESEISSTCYTSITLRH